MKNEDIKKHRGEYLDWLVRKKGLKISVLVKLAGYDRSTFYNHITKANLSDRVLLAYGKVMNHDFSADYPELQGLIEPAIPVISTFEEMERDRDNWKNKYTAVLELLNQCLKEKNKR